MGCHRQAGKRQLPKCKVPADRLSGMAALLPLVQPIGPLAQLEPRFPSAAHSMLPPPLPSPLVTIPSSSQTPVVRPDIQAAASGGCQREGLVEDCRGSSGDSGPFMLLLPWPGWLKMSAVPIVPAVATQPNCAGMPVTRADTNMPNHIIRDPATDCMK